MTCYCCRRNTNEIIDTLLQIAKEEYENEDRFVKLEMESENKKILNLQEEWEKMKKQTNANFTELLKIDLSSLIQRDNPINVKMFEDILKNTENLLGKSLDPAAIEKEIHDKIEKLKNLSEYNERMISAKEKYEMIKRNIQNENDWFIEKGIKVGETTLAISICKICMEKK